MSPATARTSQPSARSFAASRSASARSNACSHTRAPSSASTVAMPRPVPRHAPVTSATRSSSPRSMRRLLEQPEAEREHREPRPRERSAERAFPGRHLFRADLERHRGDGPRGGTRDEDRARERVAPTPREHGREINLHRDPLSSPLDTPTAPIHATAQCRFTANVSELERPVHGTGELEMTSAIPDPAPSRRERRRRELHERIIQSAIALFQQKGFDGTTALEIAHRADVAEKTFYNHFPTKQHLIEELAERSLEATTERLADARRLPGSTADRLRHFAEGTATAAEQGSRQLTRE